MTADEFRALALSLPQTAESSHMDHPDFRVRGKIFATLGPDEQWGMVKLTPEQQATFLHADSSVFEPASGEWGKSGATIVRLDEAREETVRQALIDAWRNTAPKRMVEKFGEL